MSHSTTNMTTRELASKMTVDCDAFASAITYTVQEWLTYRDEVLGWDDNIFHNYGGSTQVQVITHALNECFGNRWWANNG